MKHFISVCNYALRSCLTLSAPGWEQVLAACYRLLLTCWRRFFLFFYGTKTEAISVSFILSCFSKLRSGLLAPWEEDIISILSAQYFICASLRHAVFLPQPTHWITFISTPWTILINHIYLLFSPLLSVTVLVWIVLQHDAAQLHVQHLFTDFTPVQRCFCTE